MEDDLKLPDPASGVSVAELHFASLAGPDPGNLDCVAIENPAERYITEWSRRSLSDPRTP
jgi:hypothetical protein